MHYKSQAFSDKGHKQVTPPSPARSFMKGLRILKKYSKKVLIPNRNPVVELYRLFPQLQPGEKPVNGFTCALHKDILLQGRIVICTNCICFHSNIFGYETRLIIYFKNVLAIRREKTAFVVPNAISIRTVNKRYLFCSFLSRESVFKLLLRIWKSSMNPENVPSPPKEDVITTEIANPPEYRYEKADFNANRLLISSSASYDPPNRYSKNYDLRERPHSSPPSLCNFDETSELDIRKQTLPFLDESDNIPNTDSQLDIDEVVEAEESESGSDDTELDDRASEALKQVSLLRSRKLFKSLGDLRELQSVCKEIGVDKIGVIKRSLIRAHEKNPITLSFPTKDSSLSTHINNTFTSFIHFVNWLCMKHTAMFFVSFLFLLLALLSLSLMVRINNISTSLQKQQLAAKAGDYTNEEMQQLQQIFKAQDDRQNANLQRIKETITLNIDTVSAVQEKLRELREKLKQ